MEMEWSGHQIFVKAPMMPFTIDGTEARSLNHMGLFKFPQGKHSKYPLPFPLGS